MSKKMKIVLTVVVLACVFGYRYYDRHRSNAGGPSSARVAGDTPPVEPRMYGRIAFKPCTLAPQLGAGAVEAQCGTLDVAENPAKPKGRRIALNIAWLPSSEDGSKAPDPVFMLAGGPGQSAIESYPQVAAAFREVTKDRSVILVDQRGTGKSNPLQCPQAEDLDAISGDEAAARKAAITMAESCRDRLSTRADLRFYTTTDAVRDLDAVRQALGVDVIDLLGISYGTRVAQHYAMRYPAHTRAIVLDSVAPNTIFLGNDFARNLESALDLQFGRCGKTPACAEALGNPRERLNTLMRTLREDPPLVAYRDASTGEAKQAKLEPAYVAGLARMYAYAPAVASILPLLLNEAVDGRYANLMALAQMLSGDLSDQLAYGMQMSVICSEDATGLKTDPSMATSLLGNALVDTLLAQCEVWPKGARPANFHAPLTTPVPALLLSGELDPVTPPAYAESVVKSLPNGRALVLRGQGHNVIGAGCMPKLMAVFLETADAKALDAKCLDTLTYTPPFTSFNGWTP